MAAKFIVFEGSDGSGKATQVALLEKYLADNNITHKTISLPRYRDNMYGSFITKYLSGEFGEPTQINPYFTVLPYAVDRLLAKPLLEEWLKKETLVIADRYAYSNIAFGAAKLPEKDKAEFIKWNTKLEFVENKIPVPDLILYLFLPFDISQKLMGDRARDGHEKDLNYQKEVELEYLKLAKGKGWVTINCAPNGNLLTKEAIHDDILKILIRKGFLK